MNSEERRLLSEFLDQLTQVRGVPKDPDAESLIAQAVARQPDAHYLLVQKALLQDQALNAAKARIAALQDQLEQAKSRQAPAPARGGFLGNDPWAGAAPVSRQAPAPAAPWAAAPPPQAGGFGGGGLGGFLGTAAATAAGIAGGAFLFQGIESMLGHHGGGNGLFDTAQNDADRVENVTINEYYGTDDNEPGQGFQDTGFDQGNEGFDAYDDDDDGTLSI